MVSFIIYMTMGGYTVKIDAPPRAIQHIKDGRSWHNVRKKTDEKHSKEYFFKKKQQIKTF